MKLEFERLSVAGFRSFNDKAVITFDQGLHFVSGDNQDEPDLEANGAGKSSLFDALCWVLYGKTVRNLRGTDIVPWSGNKETKVILTVRIDGNSHKITRTINPSNLTFDGQKVGQDDVTKLIGIDFDVFTHTILLGQGQPLFFDKTPSEKMQVLSDVLNLERWEARSKLASNRVADLENRRMVLKGEVIGLTGSLDEIESLIKTTKEQRDAWVAEQAKKIDVQVSRRKELETQLEKVVKLWGEANLAGDGAGTEIVHLEKHQRSLSTKLRSAEADLQFSQAQLKQKRQELKELKSAKNCPTCGQPLKISKSRLQKLKEEIDAWQLPSEDLEALQSEMHNVEKHLEKFRKVENDANDKLRNLQPQKLQLEMTIAQINRDAKERKEDTNPHLEQLKSLRQKLNWLRDDKELIEKRIVKLTEMSERAQFWVKGFKDVRLFIVEELLAELEIVTNTMLENLGLINWSIAYGIEKETKSGGFTRGLNVTIRSPRNKEPVKWEVWSGGEGQRLRLIGSLALSEVLLNEANVHTNLEILDEPSRGLTTGGVDNLVDMLAPRASQSEKCILFVDHHRIRSTLFSSTIHVTKTKKGSVVEVR